MVSEQQHDVGNPSKQTAAPKRSAQIAQSTSSASIRKLPETRITPPLPGPSWIWASNERLKAYAFPANDEIVAKVHEACRTRDAHQIANALRYVLEAMDDRVAPDNTDESWIEATALLCRTCQEEGRIDDAARLLDRVIARGPLKESAYMDHDPLSLIESLLERAHLNELERDVFLGTLDAAINLFLPTFTERPTGPNGPVYGLGRRLLELSFAADRLQRVIGMYRRCNLIAGEDSENLACWFLSKMHEKAEYKSVVKIFLSTYARSSPTAESIHAVGDVIVRSVESAHNYRPAEVLKALHRLCCGPGRTKLRSRWATRLLTAHWNRYRNFDEIEALFAHLQTPCVQDIATHPGSIYRIMVELAFEAGNDAKAEAYFEEAVARNPAIASDVQTLGVFARFHAKAGNWEAVRAAFEAMRVRGKAKREAHARVFVPVLKAYAEAHSVRDTEAFLKSYMDELKVPLCSYAVTLMAKRYGAIRDVHSLVDWLDYCSQAGFKIDAAFTNAILVRCRRDWHFPFRQLRTLFRKIRALNPDFVDRHTERVMANAALSDSKYGGRAARGRLLSLRVDPNQLPAKGKCAQIQDVILKMKEALRCGQPRFALWIYKRALHLGAPFSQHALYLAVQARLKFAPDGYDDAYALVRRAQEGGGDVDPVVNYIIAAKLSTHTATWGSAATFKAVSESLAHLERSGLRLTENLLHRVALICLRARHFRGAVSYALKAAEVRGLSAGPCFNLQNFRILLAAYAELIDLGGIRDTINRGLASSYREVDACLTALKCARWRVTCSQVRPVAAQERAQARAVVDEAIRKIVDARKQLRQQGKKLETEALRIMKQAALDAGCPPVDFDTIPWLGGKKRSKGGDKEAAGEFSGGDFYRDMERRLGGGAGLTTAAAVEAF